MKSSWGFKAKFILFLVCIFFIYQKFFNHCENLVPESANEIQDSKEEWWKSSPFWVEDQRPQINPHKFSILINHENLCPPNEFVDILIMVTSAVSHVDRRNAIRQTWGRHLPKLRSKLIFLLGQGRDQQSKIQEESEVYHDIVQEDFEVRVIASVLTSCNVIYCYLKLDQMIKLL